MAKASKARTSSRKSASTKAPARASSRKTSKSTKRAATPSKAGKAKPTTGAGGIHEPTQGLDGWITHTEFATTDPVATKAFTKKVFGWSFREPFMMDAGDPYHLFAYSDLGGGGIMSVRDGEGPRVTPYVHVADVAKTLGNALKAGAKHVMGPDTVMPGVTLAIIEIPGGITLGLSGPK